MSIRNTSTDARDATVKNDLTSISLTVVGGINAGTETVTISTKTIATLVVAINALGKGWVAASSETAEDPYPATELFRHEAFGCLGADIALFGPGEAQTDIRVELEAGIVRRGMGFGTYFLRGFEIHHPTHLAPLAEAGGDIWPKAQLNVFVAYTAGYATIPDDLRQLCNELAASMLRGGAHDNTITSEAFLGYSYSQGRGGWMTDGFRDRLAKWRMLPPFPECVDV
jgi:hypothetical protein